MKPKMKQPWQAETSTGPLNLRTLDEAIDRVRPDGPFWWRCMVCYGLWCDGKPVQDEESCGACRQWWDMVRKMAAGKLPSEGE